MASDRLLPLRKGTGATSRLLDDLLVRGLVQREPALEGVVYVVHHAALSIRWASSTAYHQSYADFTQWLDDNCTDRYRIISSALVTFQAVEDATLFKMVYGGDIKERVF